MKKREMMNTQQRIIVVLLVLAILFSVVSIFISFTVFTEIDGPVGAGTSAGGNSAHIALVVESNSEDGDNG